MSEISQWGEHTNGDWNEEVVFKCGSKYSYSPNYRTVVADYECPQSSDVVENQKKDKKFFFELEKVVAGVKEKFPPGNTGMITMFDAALERIKIAYL